jgi:hypothetical protein
MFCVAYKGMLFCGFGLRSSLFIAYSFFAAPGINASRRRSDSIAPIISSASIRSLFFHMQCFAKSIGRVTKSMHHPLQTDPDDSGYHENQVSAGDDDDVY